MTTIIFASLILPIVVGLIFLWFLEDDISTDYGTYGDYDEPDVLATERPLGRRQKQMYDSIYTVLIEPYNTRTVKLVNQTQLRWYEEGYGIYSDDDIDGFIPLVKQGYADDPDALAFADVLERKPIAYYTVSGGISFANNLRELHSYSEQSNPEMEELVEEFENLAPDWMVEDVETVAKLRGYDNVSEMPFAEFEHAIDRERGPARRSTQQATLGGVTQTTRAKNW